MCTLYLRRLESNCCVQRNPSPSSASISVAPSSDFKACLLQQQCLSYLIGLASCANNDALLEPNLQNKYHRNDSHLCVLCTLP